MNSKIIGFILSKEKIHYTPKLNQTIQIEDIQLPFGVLSLYFYGDLNACIVDKESYSMGFPATNNLLDHNLLISVKEKNVIVENDWLGSIPLFYNETESIVSSFPKVCLRENKELDSDGLLNFLKYGFSVYEKTPFKQVGFIPFCSKLSFDAKKISIESKEDPVKQIDAFKGVSESDIWNKIDAYSLRIEENIKGDIVIPTSAGFDSRIANYFIHDRSRVKNYTYGISEKQEKSFEVQQAKKYAEKLGHQWQQIHLNNAFDFIEDWHDLYASSTHLHGMYHIEFYDKIKHLLGDVPLTMVSGICGGVFTGSNQYERCTEPKELYKLAFTHGLNYNLDNRNESFLLEKQFMERYDYMFKDTRLYPIITMRIKLLLLSYSVAIPSAMGLPAWTPFLNFENVMCMLNLPPERRKDRTWVKEFFASKDLLPSHNMFFQDTTNRLNFHLHSNYKFDPLSDDFSLPHLSEQRKQEINGYLGHIGLKSKIRYQLTTTRIVKEILKKIRLKNQFLDFLTDYQTLKALEMSMK